MGGSEIVRDAQEAASKGDWQRAYELLADADRRGLLAARDLGLFAEAAYGAGKLDVTIESWDRAHAAARAAGDRVGAAGAAARVALHLLFDTALMAPVRGWVARAEGLLGDGPETPVHAWVAVIRAYERFLAGDLDGARPWARRAIDIGAQHDPAACALGRVVEARLLVLGGEVERGLELLNDVGVASVSGDLDPLTTGVVYCELVCALQGIAQYDLAEQWTEAMERWCRTNAIGSLHGRCRVHRAEILRLRGACAEAEREASVACDELRPYLRRELGWPLSELGRIRHRLGDVDGAERALLAAHHVGWDPHPGLALVRLAGGDVAGAAASIRDALDRPAMVPSKERPPDGDLQRAPLLEAQVEIEIAANEIGRARAAADELESIAARFQSKALTASAALARGRVLLAEGSLSDAEGSFSEAARLWHEVGAPYEAALAHAGLADAHNAAGNAAESELERAAARAIFERIGASAAGSGVASRPGAALAGSAPAADRDVLRREGEYWLIVYEGRSVRVRDLLGMRYLARLLYQPGRELHVLDLVAAEHGGAGRSSAEALGDAGELLDERAKAAYRKRLVEIEEDIEEARATGDSGRIAQSEAEHAILTRELARAFGLGDRSRRAGSASERARVSVTRALRKAMARVADQDPALGRHLDHAIQTGTYCSYAPDPRASRGFSD